MTAVCGICVSNAVEENCYILMPGCGHVFDRACITNSVGVEYTCPECNNNYLLPSPYRPFQLANSAEFIEYKELHRHLMQANQTILQLQDELTKAHKDFNLEQRSRKKSNESLITLSQQLALLQETSNNLNSNGTSHLAVAVVSKDGASVNADQGPSDIQATPSPTTPMPTEATRVFEERAADKQPMNEKSRLLVCYDARIQELNENIPDARGEQKKSMKQHLRLSLESKAIVEKLCTLRYISSKISASLSESKSNTESNAVKHKNVISKFGASIKKAKEMDDASSIEEKQDKIKIYVDKIFELEEASRLSDISDLQALKTTYKEHDERLPNQNQMHAYSTVSRKLKKIKAKHAKLVKMSTNLKREKLQENLEHILTRSRRFQEKIDSHATIIEQAEQMSRELEAFLNE